MNVVIILYEQHKFRSLAQFTVVNTVEKLYDYDVTR